MHATRPRPSALVLGMVLLLAGAASLPAVVLAQDVQTGGTLIVAADSEPTNLNPAIVTSNGVFFVSSKVVEPLAEMSYEGTACGRSSRPTGRARTTA